MQISRRTMLRGVGAAMALPYLEAMGGTSVLRSSVVAPPRRAAFVFVPNGVNYEHWLPTGTGSSYALSPTLKSLEAVRSELNILTGLTLDKARANGDGPGDHARSAATFLTGRQAHKTAGNDIRLGVSVDQVIAEHIGRRTRLPSLELGCEHGRRAGSCDSGYSCAYSSNISWRDEDTPVPKVVDPGAAFERMFGDATATAANRWHMRRRASILDHVREDARRLEGRLGAADRRKLDEFQESVREIERRVQQAQADQSELPDVEAPTGIPREASRHIDLMYDMMLLAFQMDVTRVSTLMVGTGGSNRTFPEIGVMDGHHHLSHHRNNEEMVAKIRKIDAFYTERFASFVERMRSTPEGEGSLLDSCMVTYGSGICDGNRHNHENLPIIMAGRGGGALETGSLVSFPRETPLCDLYLSIIRRMGCEVEAFGDSRGELL